MSGGVYSSTAVALLQHHGYEVIGVTCVFEDDEKSRRSADEARAVCERFRIEHVERDVLVESFRRRVIEPFGARLRARSHAEPVRGVQRAH